MATSSCKRRKKCLPLGCVYAWLRPVIVHFRGWQKTKLFEGCVTLEDNKGEATTRRERKKRFADWEVVRSQKPAKIEACESLKQAFSMSAQAEARCFCFVGSCAVQCSVWQHVWTRLYPPGASRDNQKRLQKSVPQGGVGGRRREAKSPPGAFPDITWACQGSGPA